MSFVARLRPELIRVAPPWRTFEETISGLVAVLAGERLLPAAALATSPHGLYEAVPTVPIQVVALVLSPPAATAQHLTILAGIATLLRSPELRAGLLGARDAHEALRILRAYSGPRLRLG